MYHYLVTDFLNNLERDTIRIIFISSKSNQAFQREEVDTKKKFWIIYES